MGGRLVAVNVAILRYGDWTGYQGRTGIDKRPVSGRVTANRFGLEGDQVIDIRLHGGVDKALYSYASEDVAWWAAELGREVAPGNLGENLTTEGVDLTNAVIGERWRVGSAMVEVSSPRTPCRVFAGFWAVPDLIKRFIDHATPGAYLRVLGEAEIGAGDPVEVIHRPRHGVTIGVAFRALTSEPGLLPVLADLPELPARVRAIARRRLAQPANPLP